MPYIPQEMRDDGGPATNPGELHYDISQLINTYLYYTGPRPPGYTDFNAVMGVLACAQAEVYRRLIGPYEDKKIVENGDVFSVEPAEVFSPGCTSNCQCQG